jgi:hypothetical protein
MAAELLRDGGAIPSVPVVRLRSDSGFFLLPGRSLTNQVIGTTDTPSRWFRILSSFGASGLTLYPFYLAALFILAFAVPVLIAAHMSGALRSSPALPPGVDEIFPTSLSVGSGDFRVEIPSHVSFEPQSKKDFLLVSWFKFSKVPAAGERLLLISKSEAGGQMKTGYVFGLSGDDTGVRPILFMGHPGGGNWYRFAEMKLPPRTWIMFAISLREGRYLGLHAATVLEAGRSDIQLLGGYDLEQQAFVGNQSPIVVAPPGMTRFTGRIGPLGIFHREQLGEELRQLLKDLSREPLDTAGSLKRKDVALWWIGGDKDASEAEHQVMISGASRKRVAMMVARP